MARVFISYRRADSAAFSGRIYDRLVQRFGRRNVFKDVDTIPPGADFIDYIGQALRQCTVALVVIGPRWLEITGGDGRPRLWDPADPVRLEVETALGLDVTVLPVLVDGASMPAITDLPESLQRLPRINAVEVRNDPDFSRDIVRLTGAIERAFAEKRPAAGALAGLFSRGASQASPATTRPEIQGASTARPGGPARTGVMPGSVVQALPEQAPPPSPTLARMGGWRPSASLGRQVGRTTHPGRRRGSLVAVSALAAVLLLTSVLVIAKPPWLPHITGGRSTDQLSATQTAEVRAAKTQLAQTTATVNIELTQAYTAAVPGCGNDPRIGYWKSGFLTSFTCQSDRVVTRGMTYSPRAFPSAYQLSVDVGDISPYGCANIRFPENPNGKGYTVDLTLCTNGTYSILRYADSFAASPGPVQGYLSSQAPFHIAVTDKKTSDAVSVDMIVNGQSFDPLNDKLTDIPLSFPRGEVSFTATSSAATLSIKNFQLVPSA